MKRRSVTPWRLAALALALCCAGVASADEPTDEPPPLLTPLEPQHLLLLENTTGAAYNSLGLGHRARLNYRWRLYDDPGALWSLAHLGAATTVTLSPSFARLGVRLDAMPLSVLRVSVGYEHDLTYGVLGNTLSARSATTDHSDSNLLRRADADEARAAQRHQLFVEAVLQGKVGDVVLLNWARFTWHHMDLQGDHAVFYRPGPDLLIPNDGWIAQATVDLLYAPDWGLLLGLQLDIAHAFYNDAHFAPGDDREAVNDTLIRFGPEVGWVFEDQGPYFRDPTVILLVNWWLEHRYRTGLDTPQAAPFVLAAFRFRSDLWTQD